MKMFAIISMIVYQSIKSVEYQLMRHRNHAVRNQYSLVVFLYVFMIFDLDYILTQPKESTTAPTSITCESADLFRCKTSQFCINRTYVCE